MRQRADNPFRITKSNDLTDEQIDQLWVSAVEEDAISGLARPASPMAVFILGGKGSGKSHLMRYYSFPVQSIRYEREGKTLIEGLSADGYVGIYAMCSGLDSDRFAGKGQSTEKWSALFEYYFELWIADRTLSVVHDLIASGGISGEADKLIAERIEGLFDVRQRSFASVREVIDFLANIRKELDHSINNAAVTEKIEADILVSRGRLFFGIPKIVCSVIKPLKDVRFAYLLDEFENFAEVRQIYINTLVREREGPTSFKIGARLYGIRTRMTLSGGERNREGSEYEELRLDERFRRYKRAYDSFSLKLVGRRLALMNPVLEGIEDDLSRLSRFFEDADLDWNAPLIKKLVGSGAAQAELPHLVSFRRKLIQGMREDLSPGIRTDTDVDAVVKFVRFPEYPVLEKLCILHVYQKWFRGANIMEAALYANNKANDFLSGKNDQKFEEFIGKHKADMTAQLLRENGQKQVYAGIENFIRMSEGLPRTLITILKHVYDWAVYMEEEPFGRGKISIRAQQRGVGEAANLFLDQMLMEGQDGVLVGSAIERLAQLFRVNRFADKPVETSLIAFSVDDINMDSEARRVLRLALDTSLLIRVHGGQRQRNSKEIVSKIELNAMLAPRWDLPIARRGTADFSPREGDLVFSYGKREEFEVFSKEWSAKMTAPAFGRPKRGAVIVGAQPDLFE